MPNGSSVRGEKGNGGGGRERFVFLRVSENGMENEDRLLQNGVINVSQMQTSDVCCDDVVAIHIVR